MNKNAHFGNLTPRMQQFREELLECRPYICAERAVLATQSYKEHADKPITLKRAYTLANILQNMTIFIEPETLIAGNQASQNRSAPVFPEYAMDWVIRELDEFDKRDGDVFYITEETKRQLRDIYALLAAQHTALPRPCGHAGARARCFTTWASSRPRAISPRATPIIAVDYASVSDAAASPPMKPAPAPAWRSSILRR